jgi:hypothetical protein
LRRIRNWKKNSFPFLSGDLFADFSDVSLFEPRFRRKTHSLAEVSKAKIIFCPSHKYEEMLTQYGHVITARVLILGNSDRDFTGPLTNLPASIVRVFRQNSTYFDDVHQFLPIGIENIKLGQNGQRKLFARGYVTDIKQPKVLVGPFSPTHKERDFLISLDEDLKGPIHVLRGRISPTNYAEATSQFAYVSAPRGNGLDTHRFWEALYRGSYPVVVRSNWSAVVQTLGIPVIEIDQWSMEELDRVVHLEMPNFDPMNISQIWAKYWYDQIYSVI